VKPVYLDTSVVLRILTGLPEDLARVAETAVCREVNAGRKVVIADLVLLESYFALQHHYGITKTAALRNLKALLLEDGVEPENGQAAMEALDAVIKGAAKPGLVDRLIHARAAQAGGELYTFEKASRKLKGTKVLG
jgi:predicted nucleic-acid-binding protein